MAKLLPVLLLAVFLTFVIASFTSRTSKTALPLTEDPAVKAANKKYWLVILRSGADHMKNTSAAALMQDAHINAVRNLIKEGKLMVASPFSEKEELQDVFIMECKDSLEAADLLQQDAAIAQGWLKAEIRPCWTAGNMSFK